jgi:hypothetical protein
MLNEKIKYFFGAITAKIIRFNCGDGNKKIGKEKIQLAGLILKLNYLMFNFLSASLI